MTCGEMSGYNYSQKIHAYKIIERLTKALEEFRNRRSEARAYGHAVPEGTADWNNLREALDLLRAQNPDLFTKFAIQ